MKMIFSLFLGICVLANGQTADQTAQAQIAANSAKALAWEKEHDKACNEVEAKYNDFAKSELRFYPMLEDRRLAMETRQDPALLDPKFIIKEADKIAAILGYKKPTVNEQTADKLAARLALNRRLAAEEQAKINAQKAAKALAASQAKTKPGRRLSPDEQEIQDYIGEAQAGRAGVNPRDQTLARSGDPQAQARIRQRLTSNEINKQLHEGTISAPQAASMRQQAEASRQNEEQRIELENIQRGIEEQNRELRRIRMEAESRKYNRR